MQSTSWENAGLEETQAGIKIAERSINNLRHADDTTLMADSEEELKNLWLSGKESACQAGDAGSIPGSGRSPGEENGNPLQNSCLGNPMDRGAWWATVHRVAKKLDTT